MKTPYRIVRDVGGQKMVAVPDSIPLGNMYEPTVDIINHSFTFYLVRSTRPFVNNPVVKDTPIQEPDS